MGRDNKKDIIIKICCFIASFVLWIYIANIENPVRQTTINNIKVSIKNKNVLKSYNLIELPNQKYLIDLMIKGPNNTIYSVKPSQFQLEADLENYVLKKGENKVPVKIKRAPSGLNIVNSETLWININLDNYAEKKVPIYVGFQGKLKENMKISDYDIKPKYALVNGPESYVKEVSSCKGIINLDNLSESIDEKIQLIAIDKKGNKIEGVKINPNKVNANIMLNKFKIVDVKAIIEGNPKGNVSLENIIVIPNKIKITGNFEKIKGIDYIETEKIDISDLKNNSVKEVRLILPEGVKAIDNNIIKVQINLKESKTENQAINNSKDNKDKENTDIVRKTIYSDIKIKNLANNYIANLETNKVKIEVSGKKDIINSLNYIESYVDLLDKKEGSYSMPIVVEIPYNVQKVSQSPNNMGVNISLKSEEVNNAN